MILGVILLYLFVLGVLRKNKNDKYLLFSGLQRAYFIFTITFLANTIVNYLFFKEEKSNYKTIVEKEKIQFKSDFKACYQLKYGTFLVDDLDTIIRYSENKKDFEKVKSKGIEKEYLIEWIDSCTYSRIDKKSKLLINKIQLGNINEFYHNALIVPGSFHKLKEQMFLNVVKLK